MMISPGERHLQLISGRSHLALAEDIAKKLNIRLSSIKLDTFGNSETSVQILDSVRGDDVFVIQSHCGNVNDSIIEQALIIDAAKRASASSITAVCPFFAYGRQDRKANGREPISARLIVDILVKAGANRLMSIDLHTGQIQGFMDGQFEHLIARPLLVNYVSKHFPKSDIIVVSPDAGRVKSAERYSNALGCGMAIVHKHRPGSGKQAEARHLIGNVNDKVCIIVDDMIDTAGTLCAAAELISAHGAREVHGLATHGLFSPPAIERINKSVFKSVIVTDTLPQANVGNKIKVISTAGIISDTIKAVYSGGSVSALFAGGNQF